MTETPGSPIGRRVFLGLVGLGALGVVGGAKVQNWLERTTAPVLAKDPTGLLSLLPLGRFRFYTVTGSFPHRARNAYKLQVTGLVERPLTLTYAQIVAMPKTRIVRDFQCVTGWRVPDVHWTGVRLSDVLDRAGVKPEATALRFVSFDGAYSESLTLAQARRRDVIVAYELEDGPLSSDHGGPVRLYVAPMYGYKSCKWLESIELTAQVEPGYWEERGYDVDGWVGRSNGRDDAPTSA
jgi:DMSO/TMAO reductase YedYZ molybdopterin-dependent catalytic subunit